MRAGAVDLNGVADKPMDRAGVPRCLETAGNRAGAADGTEGGDGGAVDGAVTAALDEDGRARGVPDPAGTREGSADDGNGSGVRTVPFGQSLPVVTRPQFDRGWPVPAHSWPPPRPPGDLRSPFPTPWVGKVGKSPQKKGSLPKSPPAAPPRLFLLVLRPQETRLRGRPMCCCSLCCCHCCSKPPPPLLHLLPPRRPPRLSDISIPTKGLDYWPRCPRRPQSCSSGCLVLRLLSDGNAKAVDASAEGPPHGQNRRSAAKPTPYRLNTCIPRDTGVCNPSDGT